MTGSIAVSQCGHTPNRTGHHGTVVASTVGTVAISCNVSKFSLCANIPKSWKSEARVVVTFKIGPCYALGCLGS